MSFLPQMEPWFDDEERLAMDAYMREGGWLTEFKKTEQLEQELAAYVGAKHCVMVNNGTISLTLAAMACGVKTGDDVIVPNFTMVATPNSVKMFGANPIFVDVDADTLCMDITLARAAITPKTRAIMFVPANGRYPRSGIDGFVALAREHDLALIEDSAQSLGSFYPDGRHQGTVGLAGSFSFSSPKIITTGQGGCVVTNDDEVNRKLRRLKDFGRSGGGNDVHDMIGFNAKFTEMQAVIGLVQMKKLPWRVERKKEILRRYQRGLGQVKEVRFFDQDLAHTTPWFIDILLERGRQDLMGFLKGKGIGTRLMYPPINKQVAYQVAGEHPVSNRIGVGGLWLPSQAQLSDAKIDEICGLIADFYAGRT
jgi:perosamine synthetase